MLMPRQEKWAYGVRVPLPYELSVDGQLNSDLQRFEIRFEAGNAIFGKIRRRVALYCVCTRGRWGFAARGTMRWRPAIALSTPGR